jgi:hypothetical protein
MPDHPSSGSTFSSSFGVMHGRCFSITFSGNSVMLALSSRKETQIMQSYVSVFTTSYKQR